MCQFSRWASLLVAHELKAEANGPWILFGGPDCDPWVSGLRFLSQAAIDAIRLGEGVGTARAAFTQLLNDGCTTSAAGFAWCDADGMRVRGPIPDDLPIVEHPIPDFRQFPYEMLSPPYPAADQQPRLPVSVQLLHGDPAAQVAVQTWRGDVCGTLHST